MDVDFSRVKRSFVTRDERDRPMRFPTRRDYIEYLRGAGAIADEDDFVQNRELNQAVYFDWIKRGQIGCVFAQLLARPNYRTKMRTAVMTGPSSDVSLNSMAQDIDEEARKAVSDGQESLSLLMPGLLHVEHLAELTYHLSQTPGWDIEFETPWKSFLTIIGLRLLIAPNVLAETLAMGPFEYFPPTRNSPVTSLEIRTNAFRAPPAKLRPDMQAAHLAEIDTDHFLTRHEHVVRFTRWTPALRNRILGCEDDLRAKAGATVTIPTAVWQSFTSH